MPDKSELQKRLPSQENLLLDYPRQIALLLPLSGNAASAGQAVQNMNLMLGFDETAGLLNVPFPL